MKTTAFLCALLLLFVVSPAWAQLTGIDTVPGSSCAGFPTGATRLTADADQDGLAVTLICNGTTWEPDQAPGTDLGTCTNNGDTLVWDGSGWQCSSVFTPDVTPDAFDFTDQTDVAVNSVIQSNVQTITGLNAPAVITISGQGSPKFRIQSGSWVTSAMINNGQTLQLQVTTDAYGLAALEATVAIGSATDQWKVTTVDTGCAGPSYGGYCWYAAADAASCDAACAGHGGCNSTGLTFGNSSTADCREILNRLFLGSGPATSGYWGSVGCFYFTPFAQRSTDVSGATCAATYSSGQRACACNS